MLPIKCRQLHLKHLNGGCARTAAQATRQTMLHDTVFSTERIAVLRLDLVADFDLPLVLLSNIP